MNSGSKKKLLVNEISPHLQLVLDQLADSGSLSVEDKFVIEEFFIQSIQRSGREEIGFIRDLEQSYNPRVARVILILLKDAEVYKKDLLLEAITLAGEGNNYNGYLTASEPLVISGVFLLDRLRHLHLESDVDPDPVFECSLKTSKLLSTTYPKLSLLLAKGVERMKRHLT